MPVTHFPNPRSADSEGLVAIGGDLTPESLILAYRSGIFPWPQSASGRGPIPWFSPDPRAILEFNRLHIPRSLESFRRKSKFTYTIDHAFEAVIRACGELARPGQAGTWITTPMIRAYRELHKQGWAHSVEVWEEENSVKRLVGGIYGVDVDGIFAGESMFYLRPNASKLALLHLIEQLRASGAEWMDIQMLTPHMKALGASEITRDDFLNRLEKDRAKCARPFLRTIDYSESKRTTRY